MKYAKLMLACFYVLITVFSSLSLSGCLRGRYSEGNRGYVRGDNREDRHYYRDGGWYRRGPSGYDIVVSALVIGAFIESLPPRHTTVVYEDGPYYHDDRYYYKRRPQGGYVVVQEPVRVQPRPKSNRNENREKRGDRKENRDDRKDERNRGDHR